MRNKLNKIIISITSIAVILSSFSINAFADTELNRSYTITFDANDGIGKMQPYSAKFNEEFALPYNEYSNNDHEFDGWATEKDGNVRYRDGEKIAIINDIKLYAVWHYDIKACAKGANTLISWETVEGATYYKLYRSTSLYGQKTLLSSKLSTRSFTDKTALSGEYYYYHIKAYDNNGAVSGYITTEKYRTIIRVLITAGHGHYKNGKYDIGCIYGKRKEAVIVDKITNYFAKYARKNGFYVYTDAPGNKWNLDTLNKKLKKINVSAFIDVHCDWYAASSGAAALYKTVEQKKLGEALLNGAKQQVKIKLKASNYRAHLKVLNTKQKNSYLGCNKRISVLLETGCISKDYSKLKKYKKYGKGLANGLSAYFQTA